MIANFNCKTLTCIKKSNFFEKGNKYYCFADEGYDFWIHAPWLEESLGVNQIKVAGTSRENFTIENPSRRLRVLPG
jgi:hypothetical protein